MASLVVAHLTGSKAPACEVFDVAAVPCIRVGRDPFCELRYDPMRDDLVGRLHARIERVSPDAILLVDGQSRNGTFLNHRLLGTAAALAPGDVIQFGAGGPVVRIDILP